MRVLSVPGSYFPIREIERNTNGVPSIKLSSGGPDNTAMAERHRRKREVFGLPSVTIRDTAERSGMSLSTLTLWSADIE